MLHFRSKIISILLFLVLLACLMAEWMLEEEQFWNQAVQNVLWIVAAALMILCRKNGIYLYLVVTVVICVQMFWKKKRTRRVIGRKVAIVILPFLLVFAVEGIITQVYHVERILRRKCFRCRFSRQRAM